MSRYPLDPQFRLLSNFRLPLTRAICGPSQAFLRAVPCRSDERTLVRRFHVIGPDGNRIPTLIIEPRRAPNILPCLVNIHGGGFIFAAAPYHYTLAKEYALQANCRVVFPDYRLAPKHPYPAAAEDCWAVWQWTVQNARVLGIDPERIAVGGDSAGGELSAAVALMARDRGEKQPVLQMLVYPVADRRMETESSRRFRDAPVWNTALSEKMWEYYLPELPKEHIEYASPNEAPDLTGLAPAYVEAAEFDSLRDEALSYADRLEQAGVPVQRHETRGTPHGFEFVTKAPISQAAIAHRAEVLRKAFEKR